MLQHLAALNVRDAAKLMSAVEDDPALAARLLDQHPAPHNNLIGITGPPGAGKSQLVDALLTALRQRKPDGKFGVVAVDPSSVRSGGALLGDRVRMMRHSDDPNIFIRSLAARGRLGGLAAPAAAVARIMQHLGSDPVLIETVGVGQSEIEVASVANRTLLVLAPGAGDGIQLLKAGIMEIADIIVINKADLPGANAAQQQLLASLQIQHRDTPIFMVSALRGDGIEQLMDAIT